MDFMKLLREEKGRCRSEGLSSSREEKHQWAKDTITQILLQQEEPADMRMLELDPPKQSVRPELKEVGWIPTVLHADEFVSPDEEKQLLELVKEAPFSRWEVLRTRRLQLYTDSIQEGLVLPPWLQTLVDVVMRHGIFPEEWRPNHILINVYEPGQGIPPHTDGPAYEPLTATLSLGSNALMHFEKRIPTDRIGVDPPGPKQSVFLKRRSLLVFQDKAYGQWMHGLSAVKEEDASLAVNAASETEAEHSRIVRGQRISITMRHSTSR
jgi:alkylated DNA repair dioxygenase AlkB